MARDEDIPVPEPQSLSNDDEALKTFTLIDYGVFGAVLCLSLAIGMFYAIRARNKTNAEFLMGSYNLSCFPVSMSLLATYISAILVLGGPSEAFYQGIQWWVVMGGQLALPIVALTFLPIFYRLKLISVYQYLELRFGSRALRWLGGGTFVIQMLLYLSVVIYAPALALASVTGFPVWASIACVGLVGTVYTALGGLRAVVWTDVVQIAVVLGGMASIIVLGTIELGGPSNVWKVALDHGRAGKDNFKLYFAPYERHTVYNILVGELFIKITAYGCHQTMVQRYNSMKTLNQAYIALLLNIPFFFVLISLSMTAGLVMFAVYKDCDPLAAGYITKQDQILPYYVMDKLSRVPGLPGLFVACLFSGALSTLSSGLNSLAAVLWEDVFLATNYFRKLSDNAQAWTAKCIAIFFGALCVGLSFLAGRLGSVLQAAIAVTGAVAGPLLGVFFMALFLPFTNAKGASLGLLLGHVVMMTITFGAMSFDVRPTLMSTSVEGCPANHSLPEPKEPGVTADDLEYPWKLVAVSYTWYCPIGFVICVVIGSIVSFFTCCSAKNPPEKSLLHPLVRWSVSTKKRRPVDHPANPSSPSSSSNPKGHHHYHHHNHYYHQQQHSASNGKAPRPYPRTSKSGVEHANRLPAAKERREMANGGPVKKGRPNPYDNPSFSTNL